MIKFLVWFVACFFSTFGFAYLYYKLSDSKKKLDIKLALVFIVGVLGQTLIKYYNLTSLSIISYFVFYPFLFYLLNPMKLKKVIYYVLLVWIYGVILDFSLMLFVSILNYFISFNVHNYMFKLIPTIMIFILFLIISRSKKLKKYTNRLIAILNNLGYADFLLLSFGIFTFALGITFVLNIGKLSIDFLLLMVTSLTIVIFVLLIIHKFFVIENEKYLNTLKENNEFYIKVDDENRIFKHNLVAKLMSIRSVSNKKAMALIDDLVIKYNKNTKFTRNVKIIPYGLNGIIYQKMYPYSEEINFKIYNKIDYDIFKFLKPRRYNVLVEKLVVCLDNAIEAVLTSEEKVITINLFDDENNIYIEIKNSFANSLDIDVLGNKNYSSKGKKRGIGIFSILRNNEVSLNVRVVNNYFISKLSVKKRKQD